MVGLSSLHGELIPLSRIAKAPSGSVRVARVATPISRLNDPVPQYAASSSDDRPLQYPTRTSEFPTSVGTPNGFFRSQPFEESSCASSAPLSGAPTSVAIASSAESTEPVSETAPPLSE